MRKKDKGISLKKYEAHKNSASVYVHKHFNILSDLMQEIFLSFLIKILQNHSKDVIMAFVRL